MCSKLFRQYFEICDETRARQRDINNHVWGAIMTHYDLAKLKQVPEFEVAKKSHSACLQLKGEYLGKMQTECPTMYDWTSALSRRGWIGHSDDFPVRI